MSQAKCQVLIQSKCAPGERGFVTIYDDTFTDDSGRARTVSDDGIAMRVAEAFTSRNQSPNAPEHQRNNRVIARVKYRAGSTVSRSNGDVRATEALATEAAFEQLLEILSAPPPAPDAGPHPAEAQVAELTTQLETQVEALAAKDTELAAQDQVIDAKNAEIAALSKNLAGALSVTSELAAKDVEISALKAQLAEKSKPADEVLVPPAKAATEPPAA